MKLCPHLTTRTNRSTSQAPSILAFGWLGLWTLGLWTLLLFASSGSAQEIQHVSTQTDFYIQSGIKKTDIGDFKGAVKDFNTAINRSLASIPAYRHRGYAKLQMGDFEGAISDCSEVLRLTTKDSNAALAYLYRAYAKFSLKQYEGATHDCSSALLLDPSDDEALSLRGTARLQINDYEGAQNDFSEALNINHANAVYFFMRGQARGRMGDLVGAIGDFTTTLRLEPQATQALMHRARAKIALLDNTACQDLQIAAQRGLAEAASMLATYCK